MNQNQEELLNTESVRTSTGCPRTYYSRSVPVPSSSRNFSSAHLSSEQLEIKAGKPLGRVVTESEFVSELCSEEPKIRNINSNPFVAGRYKVYKFLGGGGDGNVFSAFCLKPRIAPVALKVLKGKPALGVWPSELKILTRLQGLEEFSKSCVVRMNEYFVFRDHVFISFELLGPSLVDVMLVNETGFTLSDVRDILFQVLTAANFLHQNGVIHSDIKPGNIVFYYSEYTEVRSQGKLYKFMKSTNVRLIDLEQCISTPNGNSSFSHTICTTEYRAPELILRLDFDYKCDIWSLGCTAFELFFDTFLFESQKDLVHQLCVVEAVVGNPIPPEMGRKSPLQTFDENGKMTCNLKDTYDEDISDTKKLSLYIPNYGEKKDKDYYYEMLIKFLQIDPKLRISANEALQLTWFDIYRQ